MDKDEMKNKISMALKDPILQQGFEIICKENAELKTDMATAIPLLERAKEISESLTKANEIIEGLMRFCRCFAQHHTEDIRYKEAEQFLKEARNG